MKDLLLQYSEKIEQLKADQKAFVLTTVIKVHGSASACVGSKAIFDHEGNNVFGWIGGGCAEKFVAEQSIESLKDRKARIVLADLDDEIFGLGVACGGKMEVFIDPIPILEPIILVKNTKFKNLAEELVQNYALKINWVDGENSATNISELLVLIAEAIVKVRGTSGKSLRELKDLPVQFAKLNQSKFNSSVVLLGRGRIIEELEKHFKLIGWKTRTFTSEALDQIQYQDGESVIVASHSARDREFVKYALMQNVSYVGMVGSQKRAIEIIDHLQLQNFSKSEYPIFIPAGIDLRAQNPSEIALSIVVEMITQLSSAR